MIPGISHKDCDTYVSSTRFYKRAFDYRMIRGDNFRVAHERAMFHAVIALLRVAEDELTAGFYQAYLILRLDGVRPRMLPDSL